MPIILVMSTGFTYGSTRTLPMMPNSPRKKTTWHKVGPNKPAQKWSTKKVVRIVVIQWRQGEQNGQHLRRHSVLDAWTWVETRQHSRKKGTFELHPQTPKKNKTVILMQVFWIPASIRRVIYIGNTCEKLPVVKWTKNHSKSIMFISLWLWDYI